MYKARVGFVVAISKFEQTLDYKDKPMQVIHY
jgi:hypothetical protein